MKTIYKTLIPSLIKTFSANPSSVSLIFQRNFSLFFRSPLSSSSWLATRPARLLPLAPRFSSKLSPQDAKNDDSSTKGPVKFPGRSIECEEVVKLVDSGAKFFLIDVRNDKDVEITGTIRGAVSIPLSDLKSALLMDEKDFRRKFGVEKPEKTERNIVFYGQGGVKSNAALEIAAKLGYKGAVRMKGGYDEWIEKVHLNRKT